MEAAKEKAKEKAVLLILMAFATNESWTIEKSGALALNSLLALGITKEEVEKASLAMLKILGES